MNFPLYFFEKNSLKSNDFPFMFPLLVTERLLLFWCPAARPSTPPAHYRPGRDDAEREKRDGLELGIRKS